MYVRKNKVFGLVVSFLFFSFLLCCTHIKDQQQYLELPVQSVSQSIHNRVFPSERLTAHHRPKHVDNLQVYGEASLVLSNLYSPHNPTE